MTLDVLLHQVSSGSRQLLPDGTPQLQANAIKLALMLRWGVGGDVTENGVAAEPTADLGQHYERVGLDLGLSVFAHVVLHVGLEVVVRIGIAEVLSAAGLQIVDPR